MRVIRCYDARMTMLSFRIEDADAEAAQQWAARLGVDRSELLRTALRAHIAGLAAQSDAATWERRPLTDRERVLGVVADWGPSEDWADWADAQG